MDPALIRRGEAPFALSGAKCAIPRPQFTGILTLILHAAVEAAGSASQH